MHPSQSQSRLTHRTTMTRRPSSANEDLVLSSPLRKHLAALSRRSVSMYLDWCRNQGFPATLDKSRKELDAELAVFNDQIGQASRQARLHHNPRKLIEAMCRGEVVSSEIKRPQLQRLCQSIERASTNETARKDLQELLLWADAETDFLFETVTYGTANYLAADALIKLNDRRGQWQRKPEEWKSPSHNAQRQLASLIRHLVARFPVPEFMDAAWFRNEPGSRRLREWYLHIASGKNIRTARTPIPLTSKMAHCFLQAPDSYEIEAAFLWGQVHALGGDAVLTHALLGSRNGYLFTNNDFWISVIRFFVANPLLDRRHVGPVMDYLNAQKFQSRTVTGEDGTGTVIPPPQPNMQMRGRTAGTLLAQVDKWHLELGRTKGVESLRFKPSGIKEMAFQTGGKDALVLWSIRELQSTADLVAEGKAMRHCVASYARSCANGNCSIWALELDRRMGVEKSQTIEVTKQGVIVQCRGKLNRLPTAVELKIVQRWAEAAGLMVSPYVKAEV